MGAYEQGGCIGTLSPPSWDEGCDQNLSSIAERKKNETETGKGPPAVPLGLCRIGHALKGAQRLKRTIY